MCADRNTIKVDNFSGFEVDKDMGKEAFTSTRKKKSTMLLRR